MYLITYRFIAMCRALLLNVQRLHCTFVMYYKFIKVLVLLDVIYSKHALMRVHGNVAIFCPFLTKLIEKMSLHSLWCTCRDVAIFRSKTVD